MAPRGYMLFSIRLIIRDYYDVGKWIKIQETLDCSANTKGNNLATRENRRIHVSWDVGNRIKSLLLIL
jgi:hypothetical protein